MKTDPGAEIDPKLQERVWIISEQGRVFVTSLRGPWPLILTGHPVTLHYQVSMKVI